MPYCVVHLITETSTFKDPEFQNYHRSLPLPPPTTLIGLAGAALGLAPANAQAWFSVETDRLGVYGRTGGQAKDLWKYSQRPEKYSHWEMFTNDSIRKSGIVQREIRFQNEFVLIYEFLEEEKTQALHHAFQQPAYALTLGNSDSLAKICQVSIGESTANVKEFSHCLIEGDIVAQVFERAEEEPFFSLEMTSDPIAQNLPTSFQYESPYGKRKVNRTQMYSTIGPAIKLNFEVESVPYTLKSVRSKERSLIHIPLISL